MISIFVYPLRDSGGGTNKSEPERFQAGAAGNRKNDNLNG